jgi:hypothetical protein
LPKPPGLATAPVCPPVVVVEPVLPVVDVEPVVEEPIPDVVVVAVPVVPAEPVVDEPVEPVVAPPVLPAVVLEDVLMADSTFMKLRLLISALYVPVRKPFVQVGAAANVALGRPRPASNSPPTTKLF